MYGHCGSTGHSQTITHLIVYTQLAEGNNITIVYTYFINCSRHACINCVPWMTHDIICLSQWIDGNLNGVIRIFVVLPWVFKHYYNRRNDFFPTRSAIRQPQSRICAEFSSGNGFHSSHTYIIKQMRLQMDSIAFIKIETGGQKRSRDVLIDQSACSMVM